MRATRAKATAAVIATPPRRGADRAARARRPVQWV
jgi:hypothetical protein